LKIPAVDIPSALTAGTFISATFTPGRRQALGLPDIDFPQLGKLRLAVECQDAARNVSMPRNRFERPDVAGREKSAFAERYLRIDSLPGLHKIAFHQRLKLQIIR
jgi:hypothetical protein